MDTPTTERIGDKPLPPESRDVILWRLEGCRNRHTLYEVVAIMPDGTRRLAGYCPKTGAALMRLGRKIVDKRWTSMRVLVVKQSVALPTMGDGGQEGIVTLRFTGRTERESIQAGEWPFIKDFP